MDLCSTIESYEYLPWLDSATETGYHYSYPNICLYIAKSLQKGQEVAN